MVTRKNASATAGQNSEEKTQSVLEPNPDLGAGSAGKAQEPHPAGKVKHGLLVQLVRLILFTTWFSTVIVCIHVTQLVGAPLYWLDRDYYYAYMALTKQSFGILATTITQWFSPTVVRVSWDESMRGQIRKTEDGNLETLFPERLILMANHQIYTDWLYLWWIAYTNKMHGHIYIILKEQLKYVPFLGPGMMFYGFIFMARKWASDKARLAYRLGKLKTRHSGPMSGSASLDPMWLMIYPEGTNLSANTRKGSVKWAKKQDIPDMRHALLPRSTGLQFCLSELKGTVDWVYDCTVAYEGVP
jgi:1-acyl-sn-glycerol-3-phosphate acyltransferase